MSVIKPKDIEELDILLDVSKNNKEEKNKKHKKKKKHNHKKKKTKNKKHKKSKSHSKKKKQNKGKNKPIDKSSIKLADQIYTYRSTKSIFHRFLDLFDININADVGVNVKDETLSNAISTGISIASRLLAKK